MVRYSKPFEAAMQFGFVDVVETWTYTDGRKALVIHFDVQPLRVPERIDFDDFGLKLKEFEDNKATYFVDWDDKSRDDDWDDWEEDELSILEKEDEEDWEE